MHFYQFKVLLWEFMTLEQPGGSNSLHLKEQLF